MSAVVFTAYIIILGAGYWLKYLNLAYLKVHGKTVPSEFRGVIDPALLEKISNYTLENSRVGYFESILGNILTILFLFAGLLGVYDRWIHSLTGSLLWGGLLFSLIMMFAETLLDIPFSLYRNFKIENRYGFNTMTMRLWFIDLIKSITISTVLGSVVVLSALSIIQASPAWWWLWVWTFLLVFGIFVMYISPFVIEPLFFKFEPLKAEGLEEKVRVLVERAGLKVGRVFQVDASRRSRHSNAYFTGIGRVKRIVLFDTLIEQMTHEEILAVLAHEVDRSNGGNGVFRTVPGISSSHVGRFAGHDRPRQCIVLRKVRHPGILKLTRHVPAYPGLFRSLTERRARGGPVCLGSDRSSGCHGIRPGETVSGESCQSAPSSVLCEIPLLPSAGC
jgi:STE24 endopeptidase